MDLWCLELLSHPTIDLSIYGTLYNSISLPWLLSIKYSSSLSANGIKKAPRVHYPEVDHFGASKKPTAKQAHLPHSTVEVGHKRAVVP